MKHLAFFASVLCSISFANPDHGYRVECQESNLYAYNLTTGDAKRIDGSLPNQLYVVEDYGVGVFSAGMWSYDLATVLNVKLDSSVPSRLEVGERYAIGFFPAGAWRYDLATGQNQKIQ